MSMSAIYILRSGITNMSPRLVREALASGVDVRAADMESDPLMIEWARIPVRSLSEDGVADKMAVGEMLLNAGADVNAQDATGMTALHYSAGRVGEAVSCKFLLDRGARYLESSLAEKTPLLAAIKANRVSGVISNAVDVVRLFLERGVDPDENQHESFPLHEAVTRKAADLVRELLAYGADPGALNRNGESPVVALALAFRRTTDEAVACDIVSLLMDHGADPNPAVTVEDGKVMKRVADMFRLMEGSHVADLIETRVAENELNAIEVPAVGRSLSPENVL